jgi:hypothetical protein
LHKKLGSLKDSNQIGRMQEWDDGKCELKKNDIGTQGHSHFKPKHPNRRPFTISKNALAASMQGYATKRMLLQTRIESVQRAGFEPANPYGKGWLIGANSGPQIRS